MLRLPVRQLSAPQLRAPAFLFTVGRGSTPVALTRRVRVAKVPAVSRRLLAKGSAERWMR